MKTSRTALIVVALSCVVTILAATRLGAVQSKTTYRLNAEASKVFTQIDAAQQQLRVQFSQLEAQRATLLVGAGVPEDARVCAADQSGIVTCSQPAPTPTPPNDKEKKP